MYGQFLNSCSVHPIHHFGHFLGQSYESTKILRNLCLNFARQDGQDGKKLKENRATKVTKNQKAKIWDEGNQ